MEGGIEKPTRWVLNSASVITRLSYTSIIGDKVAICDNNPLVHILDRPKEQAGVSLGDMPLSSCPFLIVCASQAPSTSNNINLLLISLWKYDELWSVQPRASHKAYESDNEYKLDLALANTILVETQTSNLTSGVRFSASPQPSFFLSFFCCFVYVVTAKQHADLII